MKTLSANALNFWWQSRVSFGAKIKINRVRLRWQQWRLSFTELWVRQNMSSASSGVPLLSATHFWVCVVSIQGRDAHPGIPEPSSFPRDTHPHQPVLPFLAGWRQLSSFKRFQGAPHPWQEIQESREMKHTCFPLIQQPFQICILLIPSVTSFTCQLSWAMTPSYSTKC